MAGGHQKLSQSWFSAAAVHANSRPKAGKQLEQSMIGPGCRLLLYQGLQGVLCPVQPQEHQLWHCALSTFSSSEADVVLEAW